MLTGIGAAELATTFLGIPLTMPVLVAPFAGDTRYHPEGYLRETFADGFAFLELEPEGARGNPTQDLVLMRKE